jgi:hypothetical protein
MRDILVTRKSSAGYGSNTDWQSLTDGQGGYQNDADLAHELQAYLFDSLVAEGWAEGKEVCELMKAHSGAPYTLIETEDWAYMWSEATTR